MKTALKVDSKKRILALDGLRGLAILGVLIFHAVQLEPAAQKALPSFLYSAVRIGQTGVDLFFVLSGYLITGILLDERHGTGYFRNFYARRILRIFPLYYLTGLAVLVIWPGFFRMGFTEGHTAWFWLYATNLTGLFGLPAEMFGHFWTLAIEEQFYLLWPLVVYFCPDRRLRRVCWITMGFAMAVRIAFIHLNLDVNRFTFCRIDPLLMGALLASWSRSGVSLERWWRWSSYGALAGVLGIVPLYAITTGSGSPAMQVVKPFVTGLSYAALVAWAIGLSANQYAESIPNRILSAAPLMWLGKYSYAIYILHPFIFKMISRYMLGTPVLGRMALMLIAPLLAAWISWHLLEKQFLKLKRFFEYRYG